MYKERLYINNRNWVEFDTEEWELKHSHYADGMCLYYIGDGKNIRNPKGNESCLEMFSGCDLSTLDLSNFDTHEIVDMSYMFYDCTNLEALDLSNFKTNMVTRMAYMFGNCESLRVLDLSNFNDQYIVRKTGMFSGCSNLKFLDISSFADHFACDTEGIFDGCKKLKYIKCNPKIFLPQEPYELCGSRVFRECNANLVVNPDVKYEDAIYDDMKKLLKRGYTEKLMYSELKKLYSISDDVYISILFTLNPVSEMVKSFCEKVLIPALSDSFNMQDGYSQKCVGDVVKSFYEKYPVDLVNRALVEMLSSQYLTDN